MTPLTPLLLLLGPFSRHFYFTQTPPLQTPLKMRCNCRYNCGATDHTHTDISSANANNRTAAPQIRHTDTSAANAQVDTLSRPLQTHSRMRRALPWSRRRFGAHANGCGWLRTQTQHLANTAVPPDPPSETGTLPTHSGKRLPQKNVK